MHLDADATDQLRKVCAITNTHEYPPRLRNVLRFFPSLVEISNFILYYIESFRSRVVFYLFLSILSIPICLIAHANQGLLASNGACDGPSAFDLRFFHRFP